MMQIMDELTDKPGWQQKIFNDEITSKWRQEILGGDEDVSEKMVDYIFDELKHKAKIFSETGLVTVYDQGVIKSDTIVPETFKTALQEAARPLEDIPDALKDWHPGSDKKVLDLAHPSLFPLVYGLSRIPPWGRMSIEERLLRSGDGTVIPPPEASSRSRSRKGRHHGTYDQDSAYSYDFQWLPCEVDISGEKARITSYINNLHPKHHKNLYGLIEELVDYSIPLWDKVLTSIAGPWGHVSSDFVTDPPDYQAFNRVEIDWGQVKPRILLCNMTSALSMLEDLSDREAVKPEPGVFTPFMPKECVCIREVYKGHGLQVIVKLANIHFTPEKSKYEGGSWHVEGQLNEHIVSTALYYYSNGDITASGLAFRQQCDFEPLTGVGYKQGDHGWLFDIYGLKNRRTVQVITKEGRLIAFPSTLQHQVQPLKFADPTKPRHRKIIALFLVDPTFKIISTAYAPSQRKDWWLEQFDDSGSLGKLPPELMENVVQDVEFPYGMKKAKELRLELMEERKAFVVEHNGTLFEARSKFSLCEH